MPVHSKHEKTITAAFGPVVTPENSRHPKRLQTDKCKEFFNSDFQTLIKRHGIKHFDSDSKQKAAVKRRFNHIIKTKI